MQLKMPAIRFFIFHLSSIQRCCRPFRAPGPLDGLPEELRTETKWSRAGLGTQRLQAFLTTTIILRKLIELLSLIGVRKEQEVTASIDRNT